MCRGWACAGLHPQKRIRSARFFTSPSVQLGIPMSWTAMSDVPWQTVAVLSMTAPTASPISEPTDWASQFVELQPYIRGFFASTSIFAVYSIASS